MSQLIISGLDAQVLNILGARAASHGRTVEGEARQILTEAVGMSPGDAWTAVDEIRERLEASNRAFTDSVEQLREDRTR
ncbi:MAG: hypothetical protein K8R36_23795 [Planctomycetales bacterium]|nr:hypothetical protein [Planctomycetales bacterium]